jgi:hypothetical protein
MSLFSVIFFAVFFFGANSNLIADTLFTAPSGTQEICRALPPIPGGEYSNGDLKDERELCEMDFYNTKNIALCPKTWSTSPATMIYDITDSGLDQRQYEDRSSCGGNKEGHEGIAKFKQTMSQSETSATFSPSSLLYYHLSRHFDTLVEVPVAVFRTMDKNIHFERVTKKAHENRMGKGDMNRAGWRWLYRAEQNPETYKPTRELFTPDLLQIYGVLLDGGGERYGAEINGVRSAWGDKQNYDFQNTPAFLALRSEQPLLEAIREGLRSGMKSSKVAASMGGGASNFQMALWMRELSEIAVLDFIMSQQDRIGNIDYKWYVYQTDEAGKLKRTRVRTDLPRAKMGQIKFDGEGLLVQRTQLVDNDAGGRVGYANFTKRTKMLENIRHINPQFYSKLVLLNHDLQTNGAIYQYLSENFQLDSKQLAQIVKNTKEATEILATTCREQKLRFGLPSTKEMWSRDFNEKPVSCD